MKIKKKNLSEWAATSLLIIGAFFLLLPLFWAFLGSFKGPSTVFSLSLPKEWSLSNYKEALNSGPWLRHFMNTAIMAGGIALSQSFFGALAGYSLGKFEYPGRNIIFAIIIGTLTLSQQVIFLPLYVLVSSFGWVDSYRGLIIPLMIAPFSIFLLRQYIVGISDAIIEAARIDGASEPGIFFKIIMPLSKPVLVVTFILSFTAFYNNLLWPLIIVRSEEMYTVSLALQQFKSSWFYRPDLVLAVSIVVILPVTIIFFILQKYFIKGVSIKTGK